MTKQKDLKRVVRARMKKTGESYTAARSKLTAKTEPAPDYAALAGMSDDVIERKTGSDWASWVKSLDKHLAREMSHRDIARLVSETFSVPSWWTQAVTVGYERIKGLRSRGQRRDGSYEATKSKTFNVPVIALFDAWANARTRKRWMDGAMVRIRTATKPKSMRIDLNDSIVAIGFYDKGKGKSSVAVQHAGLPSREAVADTKRFWGERLNALEQILRK